MWDQQHDDSHNDFLQHKLPDILERVSSLVENPDKQCLRIILAELHLYMDIEAHVLEE